MADRLYLSYWLRGFTEHNMLRHFEALLRKFPFSRLQPRALLRIYAIEISEPPLLEQSFADPADVRAVLEAAKEFHHPDCAYELETAWDIWQFEDGWNLWPARVLLCCYAPLFPSETGEQLRIDFGSDSRFLPQPDLTGSLAPIRHNIRGLLHLVEDLDATLATDKRQLWSESEEDFAVRLESALSG